jgi:hypothetical protein
VSVTWREEIYIFEHAQGRASVVVRVTSIQTFPLPQPFSHRQPCISMVVLVCTTCGPWSAILRRAHLFSKHVWFPHGRGHPSRAATSD